jgi:hypothetical protein
MPIPLLKIIFLSNLKKSLQKSIYNRKNPKSNRISLMNMDNKGFNISKRANNN